MINIIKQRIKEQLRGVLIYAGALCAYALLMISLFPSIKKMDLEALTKSMPEEFTKFFGDSGMSAYNTIEGYISMEFLSFFFILIVSFYVSAAAGSAIAGQIEKRIADFNLSQPISRTRIILAESVVALIYSAKIIFSLSIAMLIFGKIFNAEFRPNGLLAFAVLATLFLWAIYGIAILFSSFLKSKLGVILSTVGITLFFYIFSSLTRIVEKLSNYDKFSLFYLYNPQKLLETGAINWIHAGILLGILIVGLAGSIIIFNKRDV